MTTMLGWSIVKSDKEMGTEAPHVEEAMIWPSSRPSQSTSMLGIPSPTTMLVESSLKTNSLILSNYAQLLYQYEKDLDRANDYFRWAVWAEPVDGEVRSKYALFLWQGRGDIEQAEEMFLEVIEVEPESVYHQSNYAWFLLSTCGLDTCYPLDRNGDDDDDDK